MSNFQYTTDILNSCLFRAGEPTDGTSDYAAEALIQINNTYNQICRGGAEILPGIHEDWVWLRKATPGIVILQPPITTGTVTATQGSSSITFSSGPVADSDYWSIRIGTDPSIYHIAAHTAGGTAATLDSTFTGTSGAGQSYTLFKSDYDLATDVLRLAGPMRVYITTGVRSRADYKVYGADLDAMERTFPYSLIESGVPDEFAFIGETTTGTKRVRFNRYGTAGSYYRIDYEYLFRPTALTNVSGTEEPVMPRQWRHLLADFALAFVLGQKSDNTASAVVQMASAGLKGMMLENRHQAMRNTANAFRTFARQSRHRRGPLRTESGLILA